MYRKGTAYITPRGEVRTKEDAFAELRSPSVLRLQFAATPAVSEIFQCPIPLVLLSIYATRVLRICVLLWRKAKKEGGNLKSERRVVRF